MDNSKIYKEILLNGCFNKMKSIRNAWSDNKKESVYGLPSIIDIGGSDYRSYAFIMKQCESLIYEMIPYLVIELMRAYNITAQFYKIIQNDAHIYSVSENENWPDYVEQSNRKQVFAFSCKGDQKEGLYIFKEFGIGNRIPETLLETIKKKNGLKLHCYVSIVENDAYAEIINHNDDENDPTRGTGIYSLKQFFDFFFDPKEYAVFKKFADIFTEKVRDYFGFEIVRTLKPNTLHNFRSEVRDDIASFDVKELDSDSRISDSQRSLIEEQFFKEKNYEILTGSSDFAQSYMTAEWLYKSLSGAGKIDLTAIAMGYFKAIEQLLFHYLELHTIEKDGVTRTVYVGRGKPYADPRGNADLTDALISDEEKTKDINLGSLTGVFGYYDERRGQYYWRNRDLLVCGIDNDTYEFIIDTFTSIVGLRNGFFHKHNLTDWSKVVDARNSARLVFYLLLGAYKINESDKTALGRIHVDEHDDYYKLCDYMNNKAYGISGLDIPIFYLNGQTDPYGFWMGYRDDFIEYDNYGEPVYSGVYFRELNDKQHIRKATRENLPTEIWEGTMSISRSVPIEIKPSGPQKKIYQDGKFVGE